MARNVVVCFASFVLLSNVLLLCLCQENNETTIFGRSGPKTQLCNNRPCVRKCCRRNSLAAMQDAGGNSSICIAKKTLKKGLNLTNIESEIYGKDRTLTNKNISTAFELIRGYYVVRDGWIHNDDFFLIEDGTLIIELPYTYQRWRIYDNDHFCIDYVKLYPSHEVVLRPFILISQMEPDERCHVVTIVTMLISSAFLIATLTVYFMVPKLRNLHGKVLMAYAASFLGFFLTQSFLQLVFEINGSIFTICHIMALPAYFSLLATFFWMNIMSYDIWWKFRGIVRSVPIHRRGEKHKFLMYCCYGFGCPLVMTIIFAILNYLPLKYINKGVVIPGIVRKGCFLGDKERLFYLYIPMAVIISVNCVLFVATALNIWALKRDAMVLEAGKSDKQRKREKKQYLVYLKIFSLMGVSWLLQIISSISPTLGFWYVIDAYNTLMGVVIFFIFVGKKQIMLLISNRRQERSSMPQYSSRVNVSTDHTDTDTDNEKVKVKGHVSNNPACYDK